MNEEQQSILMKTIASMNATQKVLLIIGIIFLLMFLWPPYVSMTKSCVHVGDGMYVRCVHSGYAWLFDLPKGSMIDFAKLFVQWAGILILGGIGILFVKLK